MDDLCIEEILKVISNIEIDLNEGWGIYDKWVRMSMSGEPW